MTAIVIPGQSVTINFPGPSLDTVVPGYFNSSEETFVGTALTRLAPHSIFLVDLSTPPALAAIKLPSDSIIGDSVEIYTLSPSGTASVLIFAPDGQDFGPDRYASGNVPPIGKSAVFLRKISATRWVAL